jgi:NADPH-dependent 2,4-dienoyl-CoA reductase/sulfur reductase-like enzyme
MRAAETLVRAGIRPVVINEGLSAGGQIYRRAPEPLKRDYQSMYGFEAAKAADLHTKFDGLCDRIDYRPQTLVWAVWGGALELVGPSGVEHLPWNSLVLAPGAMDRVVPFEGWTHPGVFSLGGAQVALKFQATHIGTSPVFVGTGPLLYLVAYQYMKTGAQVAGVFDSSPIGDKLRSLWGMVQGGKTFAKGLFYMARLIAGGVPVHFGVSPVAVLADGDTVAGFRWANAAGSECECDCDSAAIGFGLRSETQLADLCEVDFAYDHQRRQWLPKQDSWGRSTRDGVYLAGDGAGIAGADIAELTGRRAALALLHDRGHQGSAAEISRINRKLDRSAPFRRAMDLGAFDFPEHLVRSAPDEVMVCRCEGVTAGQIRAAADEFGACEINRAKAICRVGMGRCQGRVCQDAAIGVLAEKSGVSRQAVGRLRGQAPIKPVSMRDLAAAVQP